LIGFGSFCVAIGVGWFIVIIIDSSYKPTNFLLNGYTAAVVASLDILFLISGCLFTNHLKVAASVNESRKGDWKRLNTFVVIIAFAFLVDVIVLVIISAITSFVLQNSVMWFVGRNAIYRVFEQLPVYVMVSLFKPKWKRFFFLDRMSSYTYREATGTGSEMGPM
jgi:hypothetical protein